MSTLISLSFGMYTKTVKLPMMYGNTGCNVDIGVEDRKKVIRTRFGIKGVTRRRSKSSKVSFIFIWSVKAPMCPRDVVNFKLKS